MNNALFLPVSIVAIFLLLPSFGSALSDADILNTVIYPQLLGDEDVVSNWTCASLEIGCNQASGNIERIRFDSQGLNGTIPTRITELAHLQYIYLHNNQLRQTIPTEIGTFTNLLHLYLWGNQLEGEVPSQIIALTTLRHINVYKNMLSGTIATEYGAIPGLQRLYLSRNMFSGVLPTQLAALTSLTHLEISENRLCGALPTNIVISEYCSVYGTWEEDVSDDNCFTCDMANENATIVAPDGCLAEGYQCDCLCYEDALTATTTTATASTTAIPTTPMATVAATTPVSEATGVEVCLLTTVVAVMGVLFVFGGCP